MEENELPPGPSFLEQAELMGGGNSLVELRRDVLYRNGTCLNVRVKKAIVTVSCIIGHLWGEELPRGPVPADVMVVGKWPGDQEASARRNLTGPSGIMLSECLKEAGVTGDVQGGLYVTNLVKHPRADPSTDQVSSTQFKDWAPVLSDEIALVRPKLILALGAEAAKAVLGAKTAVKDAQCCYFERQVRAFGEHPAYAARVVVVTHPAAVVRSPEQRAFFMDGLRYFAGALQGKVQAKEAPVDHRVVFEEDELAQVVDMVIQRGGPSPLIVVDAEWHGEHQSENGAYLRTIQFSDQPRFGCCVVLRGQGGGPGFCPSISRAVPHLRRLLTSSPGREVRIAGHHLRADIPRIYHELDKELGLALMRQYEAAKSPEEMRTRGGHDTMLMAHAIRETGFAEGFKLEYVAQSLLGMKRWNVELEQWKHDYCLKRKIPQKHLEGYGECPDEVLHLYSIYDVDGPQRLLELFTRPGGLLDADEHGNSSWLPYWISMRAQQAWLEIEMTGLYTDKKERGRELTETYHQAAVALLQELKVDANWTAFNPGSHFDCRELLFGEQYAGRKDDRTRPQGAVSLYLTPVRTTGKPPKNWEKVVARNEQGLYTPSTDKEVLGILAPGNPLVKKLRNWRFLRQVTTNSLRAPETDDDGLVVEGDDGEPLQLGGLLGSVRRDGRIYSHFFQTQETGRARSVRPNLMNCTKRREKDYKKILGAHYKYAVRSMFTATPVAEGEDPWLLVDFDLKGAELMMTAIQAADPVMLDHCRRNNLDEDDPNYYDIHSATAVRAFKLPCPPTKKGLEGIGRENLRIAAKCVVSGSRLQTTAGWFLVDSLAGDLPPDQGRLHTGGLGVVNHVSTTPVVGVYNGGVKPCLRVETEDGYSLESTYTHRYWVMGPDGDMVFKQAGDLRLGDWVVVRDAVGPFGDDIAFPKVPCSPRTSFKPVDFPEEFTEDWAAFLGLYISEGWSDPVSGAVAMHLAREKDPELADLTIDLYRRLFGGRPRFESAFPTGYQEQTRYLISSVALARWIYAFCPGKAEQKRVPDFVFRWPERLLAVFLRWLFEGDGSITRNKTSFKPRYSTSSLGLARDVRTLLLSFGITCHLVKERREGYDNDYYAIEVKSHRSRMRFAEKIGCVTKLKTDRLKVTSRYQRDCYPIPGQLNRLLAVMPGLRGVAREKCRECIRENVRVAFNRVRLVMIIKSADEALLDENGRKSLAALRELHLAQMTFQQVTALIDIGERQVYDVQTTDEQRHIVSYDGLLTHQTCLFGLLYGRGDDAVVRAVKEEEVDITAEEAATVREGIFEAYAGLLPFFASAQRCVIRPGHITNCFGRHRRFPMTNDREALEKMKREAANFNIQSGIADLVSRWMDKLYSYPGRFFSDGSPRYRLVLQLHDALMAECRASQLSWFCEVVIPSTLASIPVYRCDMDGKRLSAEPFHLSTDIDVQYRWGETLTPELADKLHVPPDLI